MKNISVLILLILISTLRVFSQQNWAPSIQEFDKIDRAQGLQQQCILFTGSSSIRLWSDLGQRFPDKKIVNRGFGGSCLYDLITYFDQVVVKYNPAQVVLYSGENDIAQGRTAEEVTADFKTLMNLFEKKLPETSILFISIKPSVSRFNKVGEVKKANTLIAEYLKQSANPAISFVNVFDAMLDEEGKPRQELFVADNLHMNSKGYDIWAEKIKPYLKK